VFTFAIVFAISSFGMTTAQGTPTLTKKHVQRHRAHAHPRTHAKLHTRHLARRRHHVAVRARGPYVSAEDIIRWSRVAMCEEGGNWHVRGPRFSGGLGVSNKNWVIFGGRQFASNAALASPAEQIIIAKRIQFDPPDQYGCDGAW
jgi:hypothetical protein